MHRRGDAEVLEEQLGREPTTAFTVIARCPTEDGHPLVIRNAPLDAAGDPFPTLYWLTCPDAVRAVARLESAGTIAELNRRTEADVEFAASLEAAHAAYARERSRLLPRAEGWGGVAGTRVGVKCLHAHYANHLAGGDDPVGEWVAERVEPIHDVAVGRRVAAIDQGTNSIRLLTVERAADGSVREMGRDMIITRLGQGVDESGALDPIALQRTVDVLETYGRRARAAGVTRIHMAATSAVRDASNRDDLAVAVRRVTGEDLEVITGEREAALSFAGSVEGLDGFGGLDAEPPFLVLDIGGGSTEFVIGTTRPEAAISLQLGSVRLTERLVRTDPPSAGDLAALRAEIDRAFAAVEAAVPVARARTLVAVAGTATTLQALAMGLSRYEPVSIHRTWLSRTDAEAQLERLEAMTNDERAALPVMAPGRGDVIVAGAEILVAVMRRWGFDGASVSETDILDGLAAEILDAG